MVNDVCISHPSFSCQGDALRIGTPVESDYKNVHSLRGGQGKRRRKVWPEEINFPTRAKIVPISGSLIRKDNEIESPRDLRLPVICAWKATIPSPRVRTLGAV